jgi:hypothetical protein
VTNNLPPSLVAAAECLGQRGASRSQDIDHFPRLLLGIEEGVIAQGGDVVAGIIRRHHDVALRREHGGDQHALGVGGIGDVGNVESLVGIRAVRIQHDGRAPEQARCGARGHHQCTGGFGGFTRAADGPELDVVEIHAAIRIARKLQQLRTAGGSRQFGLKGGSVQRGDSKRRIHGERAMRRGGGDHRRLAARSARAEHCGTEGHTQRHQ